MAIAPGHKTNKTKVNTSRKTRVIRRKRRRVVKNLTTVVMGKGLPRKVLVTHKYREKFTVTGTSGVVGVLHIKANGIFDPGAASAATKPLYFDQFAALYDHFCVIGSKAKFRFFPLSTNTVAVTAACFINDDTSTVPQTIAHGASQSDQAQYRLLPLPGAMSDPSIIQMNWSARKYFGKNILGNPNLQGTAAADPTELSVFTLMAQSFDETATVSIIVEVEVDYIAVWSEIKDIVGS